MAIVFRRFSVLYLEWHTKLFARCDYLPFDMGFTVVVHEVSFQLHVYGVKGIVIYQVNLRVNLPTMPVVLHIKVFYWTCFKEEQIILHFV